MMLVTNRGVGVLGLGAPWYSRLVETFVPDLYLAKACVPSPGKTLDIACAAYQERRNLEAAMETRLPLPPSPAGEIRQPPAGAYEKRRLTEEEEARVLGWEYEKEQAARQREQIRKFFESIGAQAPPPDEETNWGLWATIALGIGALLLVK